MNVPLGCTTYKQELDVAWTGEGEAAHEQYEGLLLVVGFLVRFVVLLL